MGKHTLIKNDYCDNIYTVTIGTDIGLFTGSVFCREEDREFRSDYFGWELAEIKAEINYSRAKRKYFNAQLDALTRFWSEMSKTRTYDMDAYWVNKMRKRVDEVEENVKYWTERIQYLKEVYHFKIVSFDATNANRKKYKGAE